MSDAAEAEVIEGSPESVHVVVQAAIDAVIAGAVGRLDAAAVEDLEDFARLCELRRLSVADEVAELHGEDDVLLRWWVTIHCSVFARTPGL